MQAGAVMELLCMEFNSNFFFFNEVEVRKRSSGDTANICKASKLQWGTCSALWSLKCMVVTYD